MFKRTPVRKRKRAVRKIIGIGIISLVILVLVGGVAYYFISLQFNKPLYISPVSNLDVAESDVEDDSVGELKKILKEKSIEFESVTASGSAYIVGLKSGGVVTFSSEKALPGQVSSLQFILSRLTMEGKLFSQLDLRFDKPIIRE